MIEKYRAGVVPTGQPSWLDTDDAVDLAAAQTALDGSRGYLLHEALDAIARTTARANLFIQQNQPWTLAKEPSASAELDNVLAALARSLARQAVALAAFMPIKAEALWTQLGGPGLAAATPYPDLATLQTVGWKVRKGDGLFPRPEPATLSRAD
jgi:methionyl-tRNA synthetase